MKRTRIAALALACVATGCDDESTPSTRLVPSPTQEAIANELRAEFADSSSLLDEATGAIEVTAGRFVLQPSQHEAMRSNGWSMAGSSVKLKVDPHQPDEYEVLAKGVRVRVTRHGGTDGLALHREGRFLGFRDRDGRAQGALFAKQRGVEELIRWEDPERPLSYDFQLADGFRLHHSKGVPTIVEIRDPENVARLRVRFEHAWDRDSRVVPVLPMVADSRIELRAEPTARFPLLVDPEWTDTAQPAVDHAAGMTAALHDGRVLVASGSGDVSKRAVELYDPFENVFSDGGHLAFGRTGGTAVTRLDGRVLLAGGLVDAVTATDTTEVFDPATGQISLGPSLSRNRANHSATRLDDARILLVGGEDPGTAGSLEVLTASGQPELIEPSTARFGHTATRLQDGRVLLVGGTSDNTQHALDLAELYAPGSGLEPLPPIPDPRFWHTSLLLDDGRVAIAGGASHWPDGPFLDSLVLFDPPSGTFSAGPLLLPRIGGDLALLADGTMLLAGSVASPAGISQFQVFDPLNGSWGAPSPLLTSSSGIPIEAGGSLTPLPDGGMLLCCEGPALLYRQPSAGNRGPFLLKHTYFDPAVAPLPGGRALVVGASGAEIIDALGEDSQVVHGLERHSATVSVMADWRVLIVGGLDGAGPLGTISVFDPETELVTDIGELAVARWKHTSTPLPDGTILVTGGTQGGYGQDHDALASIERIDLRGGRSEVVGHLQQARMWHRANLLPNGRVLFTGGDSSERYLRGTMVVGRLDSTETFDASTGTLALLPPMLAARGLHVAQPLPDGTILFLGDYAPSFERFDPTLSSFEPLGFANSFGAATSASLMSGVVLIAGGWNSNNSARDDVLTFDWRAQQLVAYPPLQIARAHLGAVVLDNGNVLAVGGVDNELAIRSAEVIVPFTSGLRQTPVLLNDDGTIVQGGSPQPWLGLGLLGPVDGAARFSARHPLLTFYPVGGPPLLGSTAPFTDTSMTVTLPATVYAGPGWLVPAVAGVRADVGTPVTLERGILAAPCVADSACQSGQCEQGVCCETSCDGVCSTCAAAGTEGTCAALPQGAEPIDPSSCAADPSVLCGSTGLCDGEGSCALVEDGTPCADNGACIGGECVLASCRGHSDCQGGQVCGAEGFCVPAPLDALPELGCALAGQAAPNCSARWFWALAAVAGWRRRRRTC